MVDKPTLICLCDDDNTVLETTIAFGGECNVFGLFDDSMEK